MRETPFWHRFDYVILVVMSLLIALGVYAIGALILTVLYKIAVTARRREPEAAW